jgi:hypothetical protein
MRRKGEIISKLGARFCALFFNGLPVNLLSPGLDLSRPVTADCRLKSTRKIDSSQFMFSKNMSHEGFPGALRRPGRFSDFGDFGFCG